MTDAARDEVLARIRNALGPAGGAQADEPGGYRTSSGLDPQELTELFAERVGDYGSKVRRCGPAGLAAQVAAALSERGARSIVVPAGFDLGLLPGGLRVVADDGLSAQALDEVDAVVTTAAIAVAETGTIVLDGSAGQGRRALSLIPDYHLCVLFERQVVGLVTEAVAGLQPDRPLTWISGPSATSDIELDRVQGVHGPRTLEVILVSEPR